MCLAAELACVRQTLVARSADSSVDCSVDDNELSNLISEVAGGPAEFKHINKRRKRN